MTPPASRPHYDARLQQRAVRWSLLFLAMALVAAAAIYWGLRPNNAVAPEQVTELAAPVLPAGATVQPPEVRFTDITHEVGITFVHDNGAYGEKLLPETMGGGVVFFDADADGDADLLFVNSTRWPWAPSTHGPPTTAALYRNDGGRFVDITAGSGLDIAFYGMGAAVGDYDNDGWADLVLTGVGGHRLFHNEGGDRFTDATESAGVAGSNDDWSSCSTWFDADSDGDLDLFVGHYVRWSREIDIEIDYRLVGVGRAYGQPNNFQGAFPALYRNDGNGRFTDISAEAGVQVRNPLTGVPVAKTLGVAPVDLDEDGWIDLVLANDTVQNFVLHNQGDGTFREIGALTGVAFDSYGNTRGAMGIDAAYYRNDDKLGIAIGNFANEMTALYVAQHSALHFADEAITEGVGPASRLLLKFGVFFFDYDLDGWLDLLSVNGHLEDEIHQIQPSQTYAQPAQLFWNAAGAGQVGFLDVGTNYAGPDLFEPIVGRGSAYADIDLDGDLDVVLTQVGGPPILLRNDQSTGHHWLRLQLRGRRSSREALGARVSLTAAGTTQKRVVSPTRSYLSQSELPITFGLGTASRIELLEIQWPSGVIQRLTELEVDQVLTLQEPEPGGP